MSRKVGAIIFDSAGDVRELELYGERWTPEALQAVIDWQEKVCAIIQPAENADEWGADVADIIAMRERKRKALLKRAKR